MMTEDELREQLNGEVAGIRPRGDLLKSLAHGHARRHRRATIGLISSSIVASAAAVVMVVGVFALFASGPTLKVDTASGDAQIITAVQQADDDANNMIIHMSISGPEGTTESWALRSDKLARVTRSGEFDTVVNAAGVKETVDYKKKTVTTSTNQPVDDIVGYATPSGLGDPHSWLHDPSITVHHANDGTPYLGVDRFGMKFKILLDNRSNLPKEVDFGSYQVRFSWLPATDENRALLTHTVPADFPHTQG